MKYLGITKAATLILFISLISVFLLYRTGKLDKYFSQEKRSLQTSPNGGTINSAKKDTVVKPKMDSLDKLRMYSSKSMTLVDPKLFDTPLTWKKATKPTRSTKPRKQTEVMSSSKSLILIKPDESFLRSDTTKREIKKFKQKNN